METSTLDTKTGRPEAFERLGEELRRLIAGQQLSQAQTRAEDFLQTCENKAQFYLLKGVIKYLQQDFLGAVESLLQAAAFMGNDQPLAYTSLFSGMLINAQLLCMLYSVFTITLQNDFVSSGKGCKSL